jgi:hypothetical protein
VRCWRVSPNWQGSAPKTKFDIKIDVGTYPTICDRTDGASRKSKPQSDRLLGKLLDRDLLAEVQLPA